MIKRPFPALLNLLFPLLLLSCSGEEQTGAGAGLTATLAEGGEVHTLRDDLMRVRTISRVDFIRDDAFILRSYDAPLSYFENHEMVHTFGAIGKGPCEYTVAQAYDTAGDSLFVLSTAQSKIIIYRISTGECLGELAAGSLVDHSYLARVGGAFITGRFAYYAGTPDSTALLYRLSDDGTPEALPLTLGTLNPVPMFFQMPAFVNDFHRQGDRLYAYFRYTNYLVSYDTRSGEVETHPLELELHREEIEDAGTDFRAANEIRESKLHKIIRMQVSDRWIAANEMLGNGNTENSMWLQFYTHEGEKMGRVYTKEYPVGELNGRLVYVEPVEDPDSEYAYQLRYREVLLR